MRAFLIDPEHRTITEIDFVGDYKKMQEVIGCDEFTTGSRPFNGSLSKGFDALLVSDDPLEDRDDPKHWFQIDADRNPPSSYPITGRGLVIGTDPDGADCDARISRDELVSRVTFTKRKFRGFETTEEPDGLSITIKAPIIEEQ
jgi:hypothetical protein